MNGTFSEDAPAGLAPKSGASGRNLTADDFSAAAARFDKTFKDALEYAKIDGLPEQAVSRIHPSHSFVFKNGDQLLSTENPETAANYYNQGYDMHFGDTGTGRSLSSQQSLVFWNAALGGISKWAGNYYDLTPLQSTELTIFHEWSHIEPGFSSSDSGEFKADKYALQHVGEIEPLP